MSKSKWYLEGFDEGSSAAIDTDWQDGEMEKAIENDSLGEIANQILENWQQMAGTIYYDDVTENQLEKWENGFFDGFEKQSNAMYKKESITR